MFDSENSQVAGQQDQDTEVVASEQDAAAGEGQEISPQPSEVTDVSNEPSTQVSQTPSELEDLKRKYSGASQRIHEERVAKQRLRAENEQLKQYLAEQQRSSQQGQGPRAQASWYENPEAQQWDLPTMGKNMDQHYRQIIKAEFEETVNRMLAAEQAKAQQETQMQTVARVEEVMSNIRDTYGLTPEEVQEMVSNAQQNPHVFIENAAKAMYADRIQAQQNKKAEQAIAKKLVANSRQVLQTGQGATPQKQVDNRPWVERMMANASARESSRK